MITDGRPDCATRHIALDVLTPSELDAYLAQGWYRIGQHMIYCESISWKQRISGVIWTRVPLEGYRFSKNLRRKRRKVEETFEVAVHKRQLDDEHEQVYQRYLEVAPGERSQRLADVLYGGRHDIDLFDTWEVSIRLDGELVAFSWFDRGETSLQSIIGVYDPDYAAYSLGLYTMIKELDYGLTHGFEYYYAGYILCDDPAMDYKLRTGSVQLLDRTREAWVESESLSVTAHDPILRTYQALQHARHTPIFAEWQSYQNKHFELSAYAPNLTSCLAYPAAIWHPESATSPFVLVLTWDSVTQCYELLRCLRGVLATPDGAVTIRDLFVVDRTLGHSASPPASLPTELPPLPPSTEG